MAEEHIRYPLPQDRTISRREFMGRMAMLTAALSVGSVMGPARIATAAQSLLAAPSNAYAEEVRPEALADPTELTISEAAFLIKQKELKSSELVQACLDRIRKYDSTYQAFNTVLYEEALRKAKTLDNERNRGPLHGIPLAIKDNYYTKGIPTTANSYIFKTFVPTFDATAVKRLNAAGAILLGKTQMGPLATTRATTPDGTVTTVNAWTPEDPAMDPGGSSTGSSTATAGRMATSSIGTQTGGSITGPSNAQGLTGLKPTLGRTSVYGVIPLTYTRDHVGPLARDAKDAAIMVQAMAGPDPEDPRTQGLPPVPDFIRAATPVKRGEKVRLRWPTTIGVIPGYTDGGTPLTKSRSNMLAAFKQMGAKVIQVPLPKDWELLTGTFNNVRLVERSEPFLEHLRKDVRLFGVSLNTWMMGLFLSGDEYLKGQRAKLFLLQKILDELFDQCDVVVQTSPVPFDIVGLPEIAFPIGFEEDEKGRKIPLGAILGGMPYGEERLLSLAAAYQEVTDHHRRRPPDPTSAVVKDLRIKKKLTAEEAVLNSE